MSLADQIFIDMCKDILANGTDTRGQTTGMTFERSSRPSLSAGRL